MKHWPLGVHDQSEKEAVGKGPHLITVIQTGETGKRLRTRMWEHKGAIRRHEATSQVWAHTVESGHTFDFDSVRVIDRDQSKRGRLIRKAHTIQLVQPLHRTASRVPSPATPAQRQRETKPEPVTHKNKTNDSGGRPNPLGSISFAHNYMVSSILIKYD